MMNTTMKLVFTSIVALGVLSVPALADMDKGQKIFATQMRTKCGFSGNVMAKKHTQNEWKVINEAGQINAIFIKECPNASMLKNSDLPHVYDFLYNYAVDSGNVANCQ